MKIHLLAGAAAAALLAAPGVGVAQSDPAALEARIAQLEAQLAELRGDVAASRAAQSAQSAAIVRIPAARPAAMSWMLSPT